MPRSTSSTPACTTMVNMGAVRAGDLVRPDAVAQIGVAPGAGDGNLHLGQASILARLELGQNRIAAVYGFLIERHAAAIAGVQRHNQRQGCRRYTLFPKLQRAPQCPTCRPLLPEPQ